MADGTLPPVLSSSRPIGGLTPLRMTGVRLVRKGQVLLNIEDLTIGSAGVTVLLGPNGAGKSLLLRVADGLIRPDAGAVTWGGLAPDGTVRRRIGFVFQQPVLLRRSVRANLKFAMGISGLWDRRKADRALEDAGLAGLGDRPARVLSGGERQRLALARALVLDPEVLLLDEPTASLDPAAVAAVEGMIGRAVARGLKVVLVTHDIGQARRLADEVIFLHRGQITEQTPARLFFADPRSAAAKAYLSGLLIP